MLFLAALVDLNVVVVGSFSRDTHLQLFNSYCVVLSFFSFVSILISALVSTTGALLGKLIVLEFVAQRV